MNSPSARPRRWLQFSLRTLFVLMLLVAAYIGGRESMRPAIEAERLRAKRAQDDAMVQQAAAMMERDRAVLAEVQSRLMLEHARSSAAAVDTADSPSSK